MMATEKATSTCIGPVVNFLEGAMGVIAAMEHLHAAVEPVQL
jgi:hypothetical protein